MEADLVLCGFALLISQEIEKILQNGKRLTKRLFEIYNISKKYFFMQESL